MEIAFLSFGVLQEIAQHTCVRGRALNDRGGSSFSVRGGGGLKFDKKNILL